MSASHLKVLVLTALGAGWQEIVLLLGSTILQMVGRLTPVIVLSQKQLLSNLWDLPSCPTWAGAEGPG